MGTEQNKTQHVIFTDFDNSDMESSLHSLFDFI